MNRTSLTLTFVILSIACFGQSELTWTWILDSYQVDSGKLLDVKKKQERDKITFNKDGQYKRTYYKALLPDTVTLKLSYSFLDEKMTEQYFDKNGRELQTMAHIKSQIKLARSNF